MPGLAKLAQLARNLADNPGALKKLMRLQELSPDAVTQIQTPALQQALEASARGDEALALMRPGTFLEGALPLIKKPEDQLNIDQLIDVYKQRPMDKSKGKWLDSVDYETGDKIDETRYLTDSGASHAPFLEMDAPSPYPLSQVRHHQGRHRANALQSLGTEDMLVSIKPRDSETLSMLDNPDTQIYNQEGKSIGSVAELLKILGLGGLFAGGGMNGQDASSR